MKQISLNPSAVSRVLGTTAFLLILASTAVRLPAFLHLPRHVKRFIKGLLPVFDVSYEQNIPTYFSVLLLILAAGLLAAIAVRSARQGIPDASKWTILSVGFLCMGYDEGCEVHETLVTPFRTLLGSSNLGVFYYAWVIPGIALVGVLALFFLKFLFRLPAPTRFRFLLAGALYIGGCIGFEMVGGYCDELYGSTGWRSNVASTFEEGLEMAGLIVFIHALLRYLADNYGEVRLRFNGVREEPGR